MIIKQFLFSYKTLDDFNNNNNGQFTYENYIIYT